MFALKAVGFTLDELWRMTPKQMAAWLFIAGRHRRGRLAEQLSMNALAMRGERKEIQRALRDLSEDR